LFLLAASQKRPAKNVMGEQFVEVDFDIVGRCSVTGWVSTPATTRHSVSRAFLVAALGIVCATGGSVVAAAPPAGNEMFAKVGDTTITVAEYAIALREEARKRFYHGRPSEGELVKFQREVADTLIERELVIQEAARHGMRVDNKLVDAELARQRERTRKLTGGSQPDEKFWRALRKRLEQEQMVEQFRSRMRSTVPLDEKTVRAYYRSHPEKFTEPTADRVSVILLKVYAGAPGTAWDAARSEAAGLVKQIRSGADFAQLARVHSADPSSGKGGDMGFMHKGRLGHSAEAAIEKLRPGQITEPLMMLEGIAIFRLEERRQAKLNSYETVQERARKLWFQEEEARRWKALVAQLRSATSVSIVEKYLDPRAGQATRQTTPKGPG